MFTALEAAALTDTGRVREQNEDAVFKQVIDVSGQPVCGLFVVADGVGGNRGGELASAATIKAVRLSLAPHLQPLALKQTVKLDEVDLDQAGSLAIPGGAEGNPTFWEAQIRTAVGQANTAIRNLAKARPRAAGDAGSTVTLALVCNGWAHVGNVGDSRTYLYSKGELTRLTHDHSLVQALVDQGQISTADVYSHPMRNVIFRSLGEREQIQVDLFHISLEPGDTLLLCSDGLWEMVHDDELSRFLFSSATPRLSVERLVRAANEAGGHDNISAVVVRCKS